MRKERPAIKRRERYARSNPSPLPIVVESCRSQFFFPLSLLIPLGSSRACVSARPRCNCLYDGCAMEKREPRVRTRLASPQMGHRCLRFVIYRVARSLLHAVYSFHRSSPLLSRSIRANCRSLFAFPLAREQKKKEERVEDSAKTLPAIEVEFLSIRSTRKSKVQESHFCLSLLAIRMVQTVVFYFFCKIYKLLSSSVNIFFGALL